LAHPASRNIGLAPASDEFRAVANPHSSKMRAKETGLIARHPANRRIISCMSTFTRRLIASCVAQQKA